MESKFIIFILLVFLVGAIILFFFCLLFAMEMNREAKEICSHCNKLSFELQELRKRNKNLDEQLKQK